MTLSFGELAKELTRFYDIFLKMRHSLSVDISIFLDNSLSLLFSNMEL